MWTPEESTLLSQLEETQKSFWNIDRATANFLNMLIKLYGAKNGLEIGTSNGYSGIWLAKALKENGGSLTTIEYYEKRIVLAQEHFKICKVDDAITIKQGSALDVLETLDMTYDFVFIDANKREYVKYFEKISPLLKKGGIIAADNILSHAEKVEEYVSAVSSHPDYQTQLIPFPAGLLLSIKL
ncbi:O-methyltransferase [bacterium]|nr:O-methyltransferase [bacterium]